jgi:multidrug efflux pump subunit AcrA (membrane-fusion protein)
MPIRTHILLLAAALFLVRCGSSTTDTGAAEAAPKAQVTVTHVVRRAMERSLELQGTSLYLRKNLVTAPIPAYLTAVHIRLGERVSKGQLLFELQTREARALGDELVVGDSTVRALGRIRVIAPSDGIVTTLDRQMGDYALEGSALCTLAESSDLVFQVNTPFEVHDAVKPGTECTIRLPDGTTVEGRVATELIAMDRLSQTQAYVVKPLRSVVLPEGLLVRVAVVVERHADAQVLPRSAVLADELLEREWVMQLLNDSLAVQVPVRIGLRTDSLVEVVDPAFAPDDRILVEGNYGLPDSALVRIISAVKP